VKRAKMTVSLKTLTDMLTGELFHYPVVSTTAPKDLKVIGIEMTFEQGLNRTFTVFLESDFFEDIAEGKIIPQIKPFEYTT
jgi:hypothetical protein